MKTEIQQSTFTGQLHNELHKVGLDVPTEALTLVGRVSVSAPGDPSKGDEAPSPPAYGAMNSGCGGSGKSGGSSALAGVVGLMMISVGGFMTFRHMRKRMAMHKKAEYQPIASPGVNDFDDGAPISQVARATLMTWRSSPPTMPR